MPRRDPRDPVSARSPLKQTQGGFASLPKPPCIPPSRAAFVPKDAARGLLPVSLLRLRLHL
ncbi:hypothetical protein GCM10023307_15210 [Lysobacter hankyongensis]|uniref:Uncharacterized protein n=1 Tax=Lysobacter hankyongensis TaxID=1176535 RepID=A0ABP9B578_9GAMM